MELEVICGARKTIERCRPLLFVETLFSHSERILDLLGPDWCESKVSIVNSIFYHDAVLERDLLRSMHDPQLPKRAAEG
jgi:hypothetical protein